MVRARDVSLVIPAYNHERFVGAALASVQGQTLVPGNSVVVDDGSTDETLSILAQARLPGFTLARQSNRGAHIALNRAIAVAPGPWIAILNSDDLFGPERIERALGVGRAERAGLVLGSVRLVDDETRPLDADHPTSRWYGHARERWARAATLAEGAGEENAAVTTSNFFFLKALWRRLGGFRPYRYVHDYDFLLRALELCPERVVFEPELDDVLYRVHGANTIAEDVDRALTERATMLRSRRGVAARIGVSLRRGFVSRSVSRGSARAELPPASFIPTVDPRIPRDPQVDPAPSRAPSQPFRCGIVVRELDEGGLEGVVATLALGLREQGIEPYVLCLEAGGGVAARIAAAGVPVQITDGRRGAWRRWMRRVRPDILSTHYVPLSFLKEAAALGIPAVETVHNTYGWYSEHDWREEQEKRTLLTSVVAVSTGARDYYVRRVAGADLPTVIPNGLSSPPCLVPRSYARRVLGVDPDALLFTSVGRLSPQKNQDGLLAAFREVCAANPNARLVLAGSGADSEYGARIRALHRDLIDSGRVRVEHFSRGVGPLLSAADGFVMNSFYEGWSLAASEAVWCGLPLVLSECGGSRELVGEAGERGALVRNPSGDPLTVSPSSIAAPPPDDLARNRDELVQAMLGIVEAGWTTARRDTARAWARASLAADPMLAAYAGLLRSAIL